jgi:hypothetical protein
MNKELYQNNVKKASIIVQRDNIFYLLEKFFKIVIV